MADSAIRLLHVGSYGYGWEDIGHPRQPFGSYTCNFNWQTGGTAEVAEATAP